MNEVELVGIIRDVNAQYAVLFGQVITINFAMVVAIYYFLHRARLPLKLAAFACYLIGMLSLIGLMLQQPISKAWRSRRCAACPRTA